MNYQTAYIRIPSWLPIPGTEIIRANGESEPFELPAYMGQSFTELCRLTPLINEMLQEYYDGGDGVAPSSRASFIFAQQLYTRLLDWADGLPMSMARGGGGDDMMPHHAAIVHIIFHTTVMDLFRPFPFQQPQTPFRLDDFSTDNPTPEGICIASVNQLRHLILVFRSRYPYATCTMLWQNALLYVANASLPLPRRRPPLIDGPSRGAHGDGDSDQMDGVTTTLVEDGDPPADETDVSQEDAHRSKWFTACIDALRALAPQFSIVTGIVQGILSMAILKGSIPAVQGRAIMDQLKADTEASSRYRRAHFSSGGAGGASQTEEADVLDGEEDEEGASGDGIMDLVGGHSEGEGRETPVGRVGYRSSGRLGVGGRGGGKGTNLAPGSGLVVNLPGAQLGGNRFVIDLDEASVNPSAACLGVLARAFDELAMFDEFTTSED